MWVLDNCCFSECSANSFSDWPIQNRHTGARQGSQLDLDLLQVLHNKREGAEGRSGAAIATGYGGRLDCELLFLSINREIKLPNHCRTTHAQRKSPRAVSRTFWSSPGAWRTTMHISAGAAVESSAPIADSRQQSSWAELAGTGRGHTWRCQSSGANCSNQTPIDDHSRGFFACTETLFNFFHHSISASTMCAGQSVTCEAPATTCW